MSTGSAHFISVSSVYLNRPEDVNQDKNIGVKEFDLLLKNLEFRETLVEFGGGLRCKLRMSAHRSINRTPKLVVSQ